MSADLLLTRVEPLGWPEVQRGMNAVSQREPALTFWSMSDEAEGTNVYFWNVPRVSIARVIPDPDEVDEQTPNELRQPYVVISANSRLWPWTEWTAFVLSAELSAGVFDPQEGVPYRVAQPEHGIMGLRRLHDAFVSESRPTLRASYWALRAGQPTRTGLCAHIDAIEAAARAALGIELSISRGPDAQVNLWHSFRLGDSPLTVSSTIGSGREPNNRRTVHVTGPVADPRVHAFADELAHTLGVSFRRVDELR